MSPEHPSTMHIYQPVHMKTGKKTSEVFYLNILTSNYVIHRYTWSTCTSNYGIHTYTWSTCTSNYGIHTYTWSTCTSNYVIHTYTWSRVHVHLTMLSTVTLGVEYMYT